MDLVAAVDEVASETQLSEGWTYALFPRASVTTIDAAVTHCGVKHFHGKRFKKSEAADYRTLLTAARQELESGEPSVLLFTLLELSWKKTLVPFAKRIISNGMGAAGITDSVAVSIGEHLFPGLITLQRLTDGLSANPFEIEIDSDDISRQLGLSTVKIRGHSVSTAKLLSVAYNAYRIRQFPGSPELATGGLRALNDANSRAIQVADVFGNFALSYAFVHLGHTSKTRAVKAKVFEDVFGDILDPSHVTSACMLVGANDIQLKQAGGLTLRIG